MASFKEQIQRIKEKLLLAKTADPNLQVFGANKHKYEMNSPARVEQVAAFEARIGLTLPACYKAFMLEVGNGGAGPFYGIYQIGQYINTFADDQYLRNDCLIYPGMTKEHWNVVMTRLHDDISDEDYPAETGRVFGGILPIGTQGCTYLHGIILNGPHEGKVVNLSEDRYQPIFTYEDHFLDWYERWLDEAIAGELTDIGVSWFGYYKGGPDTTLIQQFLHADDMQEKKDYLEGVQWKKSLSVETIDIVEREYFHGPSAFKDQQLLILTKHAYERARPILIELAPVEIGKVCSLIHYYAKDKKEEWVPFVHQYIHTVQRKEDFQFCTWMLTDGYGDLLAPFMKREDAGIRELTIYYLGKLKDKDRYLDTFIKGLYDTDHQVVHDALGALYKVKEPLLLAHFKKVAERYPEDTKRVLTQLNYCLKSFGHTHETIRDVQ